MEHSWLILDMSLNAKLLGEEYAFILSITSMFIQFISQIAEALI